MRKWSIKPARQLRQALIEAAASLAEWSLTKVFYVILTNARGDRSWPCKACIEKNTNVTAQ
jgi:hypothetical protein